MDLDPGSETCSPAPPSSFFMGGLDLIIADAWGAMEGLGPAHMSGNTFVVVLALSFFWNSTELSTSFQR